jgi:hypothetical protein
MRMLAGLAAASAAAAGAAVAPATPAPAAARGVTVKIVELPEELVAGGPPARLTVVASRSGGAGCFKVRWSTLLRVDGLQPDQLRVERIEEGPFPTDVREVDGATRVTDQRFDPGSLCRNRTVTARYELTVAADATDGTVTFRTEAYAADRLLLDSEEASRDVLGSGPPATESAEPTAEPAGEPAGGAGSGAGGPDQPVAEPAAETEGLPVTWFLVGGVLVFVGLILLLNVRLRREDRDDPDEPTGRLTVRYRSGRRRSPAAGGFQPPQWR